MNEVIYNSIETPALIIDVPVLKENIREYQAAVSKNGCNLRAHIKTHKMPKIAKMQIEAGAKGIVCSKISEAEIMADSGIDDILIAYPIIGEHKLRRLVNLNERIKRLIVSVESLEGGKQLSYAAVKYNQTFRVIADIDVAEMHRTGFTYESAVDSILQLSKMPGLKVIGVYAYAYMTIRGGKAASSPKEAGEEEGKLTTSIADELRSRGLDIEIVAGGSSPTGRWVATVPGITEVHPGTYIFYDNMSNFYGITPEQCSAYILATVVCSDKNRIVIDGGSKTFSTDITPGSAPLYLDGYGKIIGNDNLILSHLSEEHGIIVSKDGTPLDIPIGTKLKIIPNHICPAIVLHEYAYFIDGEIIEKVKIEARGKLI